MVDRSGRPRAFGVRPVLPDLAPKLALRPKVEGLPAHSGHAGGDQHGLCRNRYDCGGGSHFTLNCGDDYDYHTRAHSYSHHNYHNLRTSVAAVAANLVAGESVVQVVTGEVVCVCAAARGACAVGATHAKAHHERARAFGVLP